MENENILQMLEDNSTSRFFIVYQNGLANHIAHGIVALHRLGASKERIEQFVKWYQTRLEGRDGPTANNWKSPQTNVKELLGARCNYYTILEYYTEKYHNDYNSNINLLVSNEFPKLQNGMMGAVFHGMIQTGYGMSVKSAKVICEGLAYMHMVHVPFVASEEKVTSIEFGNGTKDILSVLRLFAKDKDMLQYYESEGQEKFLRKRVSKMIKLKGNRLMDYVNMIKMPVSNLETMQEVIMLCKWVIECATVVYVQAEYKNDFFLLHGVTAAWSLLQLLYSYDDPKPAIEAVKTFLSGLLAVYMCQGSPKLSPAGQSSLEFENWDEIIKATLRSECDEHVYKLVQVVYEMSKETDDMGKQTLYKSAANEALNNNLYFYDLH